MISNIYTRRGRAPRRKIVENIIPGVNYISNFVETEKYKNIERLKRNCIHESDCCACYDQVYEYTISTIMLSCNYCATPSCVGVHNLFYLSSDLPLSCIQFEFVRSDIITSESI